MTTSVGECSIALRHPAGAGHYSVVDTPVLGSVDGAEVSEYKGLSTGEEVEFEWEAPGQDGFDYRAVVVRHRR